MLLIHAALSLLLVAQPPAPPEPLYLTEGLAIEGVAAGGRVPIAPDALLAFLCEGSLGDIKEGDAITLPDGSIKQWRAVKGSGKGVFQPADSRRGYLLMRIPSESDRTMLLEAAGHAMVYVDGRPRVGDPYSTGYVRIPVPLRKGISTLLFAPAGRGALTARLLPLPGFGGPAYFNPGDDTLPDALGVGGGTAWIGTVVMNSSPATIQVVVEAAPSEDSSAVKRGEPCAILPFSVRKIPVEAPVTVESAPKPRKIDLAVKVVGASGESVSDRTSITLRPRDEFKQTYKRTFQSGIDGSIQYFAVAPASSRHPAARSEQPPILPLILSLHGAGVEAIGQADAYGPRSWADIVCPTNRRPFGFDWEDWGRLDAYEVLAAFGPFDPDRLCLTGHSMGGHGTWQLACLDPGRFAAIGPSAGWASFTTYAAAGQIDPLGPRFGPVFKRAGSTSDTMTLLDNLDQVPVYILHGDKDDNVPPSEAKRMADALSAFHRDWHMHQEPGAGHWWDGGAYGPEPGAACVDWPPMMDLFRSRTRVDAHQVRFMTMNPGVSATRGFLTIEQPLRQGEPASADFRTLPHARRFIGTTRNVRRIAFNLTGMGPDGAVAIEIDGQKIESPLRAKGHDAVFLGRESADGPWAEVPPNIQDQKRPGRFGPFKAAFNHRFVFVYGTSGTPEQQDWALSKARYDAEAWWYRANGSVDVISDAEFLFGKQQDRNIILYGNAQTNRAWQPLLGRCPVQVSADAITIGQRTIPGSNLACLLLYPNPDAPDNLVAAVSGTGLPGMRLTERLPYLASGVGYPDVTVFSTDALRDPASGVKAAGFFDHRWSLEQADFVWPEEPAGK